MDQVSLEIIALHEQGFITGGRFKTRFCKTPFPVYSVIPPDIPHKPPHIAPIGALMAALARETAIVSRLIFVSSRLIFILSALGTFQVDLFSF
jgi:hypothetical protein